MTQIFASAPIWVWPLLAALIFVGLRARHERTVPVVLIYGLPALGVLALRSTAALPAGAALWVVFALAYGVGLWGGYVLQQRWLLRREGARVRLAGESLTLVVMMIVFGANFAGGVLQAVAPEIYGNSVFHVIFATLVAASSGSFAGRAFRVWG